MKHRNINPITPTSNLPYKGLVNMLIKVGIRIISTIDKSSLTLNAITGISARAMKMKQDII
jgi:hypothetical protein